MNVLVIDDDKLTLSSLKHSIEEFGHKVALAENGLRPGANAVLTWGGFEAFCTIAWTRQDACGLDFDTPLRPNVLIATRDLADAAPRGDARRLAAQEWATGRINR